MAAKIRLQEEGLTPYRRRAKRLIYRDQVDAVYLLARDHNIPAAKELRENLKGDALVQNSESYEYNLRPDFVAKKNLRRERAIVVSLRRKLRATEWGAPPDFQDDHELSHEAFDVCALESELADYTQISDGQDPKWEQLRLPADRQDPDQQ